MRISTPRHRRYRLLGATVLLSATLVAPSLAFAAAAVRGGAEAVLNCCGITGNTILNGDTFSISGTGPGDRSASHFVQRTFPAGVSPVLGMMASAEVSAFFGRVSAYATAEATGSSVAGVSGVSAAAEATVFDSFVVKSGSLPLGSSVALTFDLDVVGNGRFDSRYLITQISQVGGGAPNGPPKRLTLELFGGFDGIGGQKSGVIQALVGEQYKLEYSLRATALVSAGNLSNATRFAVSDYAHTAHFYAQPESGAAFLDTESNFDYTRPAPVPLPASVWMILPALGVLRRYCRPQRT
jgi:hypothetical protein